MGLSGVTKNESFNSGIELPPLRMPLSRNVNLFTS